MCWFGWCVCVGLRCGLMMAARVVGCVWFAVSVRWCVIVLIWLRVRCEAVFCFGAGVLVCRCGVWCCKLMYCIVLAQVVIVLCCVVWCCRVLMCCVRYVRGVLSV